MKKIYSEPGRSLTAQTELLSLIFHLPEIMVQYFGLCTSKCQESFEAEFNNDKKLGLDSNLYIDVHVHYYIMNIKWRCIIALGIQSLILFMAALCLYITIIFTSLYFHHYFIHISTTFCCFMLYYTTHFFFYF